MTPLVRFSLSAIACLAGSIAPLLATDAVITADAQINSTSPASNFGSGPSMLVSQASSALVQFDLSTLPAGIQALDVSKATLVFYASQVGSAGVIDLATVNAPWTEPALTFANAPSFAAVSGATASVSQPGQYVTFDVTTAVRNWINVPSANNGFELFADSATPGLAAAFDTKESTGSSHPARLEIEVMLAGPQGPAGPVGPVGAQGVQGFMGFRGATGPNLPDPLFGTNTGTAAAGKGRTCTLGEIILNAGTVANGLPAAGQVLPIATYPALFEAIGGTFGSDGKTYFLLPDLRSAAPNGLTYSVCAQGILVQ